MNDLKRNLKSVVKNFLYLFEKKTIKTSNYNAK